MGDLYVIAFPKVSTKLLWPYEKYAMLERGGTNPFIDPQGYQAHPDRKEKEFKANLEEQKAPNR